MTHWFPFLTARSALILLTGAVALEAGDRRLGHAGQLGQVALTPAPLLPHAPHLLPQLERKFGCRVRGLDRRELYARAMALRDGV